MELSVKEIKDVISKGETVCEDNQARVRFYFYRGNYYKYCYKNEYFVSMVQIRKSAVVAYIRKTFNEEVRLEILDGIDPEIATNKFLHHKNNNATQKKRRISK